MTKIAVITGIGAQLSESLAKKLLTDDYIVIGLSRHAATVNNEIQQHSHFAHYPCDIGDPQAVEAVFNRIRSEYGHPSLLIHNAAQLLLADFMTLTPDDFEQLWRTCCLGAVNTAQQVIPAMLNMGKTENKATIIFTGATASTKAGAQSAAFASAKFGLRGLAQSLARAYQAQGIHIIHTVIDGVIWGKRAEEVFALRKEQCMSADDISSSYLSLIEQAPSCWTHEIDLRPYGEKF